MRLSRTKKGEKQVESEPGFFQNFDGTNVMGRADLAGNWEKDPTAPCEPWLRTDDWEPQTQLPELSCGCSVMLQI